MEAFIILSKSFDIYHNLSFEERLLNNLKKNQCILFLWRNENAIVMGKNQNPWKECLVEELYKDNIKLARRMSGGGAVFHDLGNLNFSFITDKKCFDPDKSFQIILSAIRNLGIPALKNHKHDLLIDQFKFSGNAFIYKKDRVLHHGTILISSRLTSITKYLKGYSFIKSSMGVASNPAEVINLSSYSASVNINNVINSLTMEFSKFTGQKPLYIEPESFKADDAFQELYQKNISSEWLFGRPTEFEVELRYKHLLRSDIKLSLKIESGIISKVSCKSKNVNDSAMQAIYDLLHGIYFFPTQIEKLLLDILSKNLKLPKSLIDEYTTRQFIGTGYKLF